MALPLQNLTSYGGWQFSSLVKTVGLEIEPVYDEARRTVVYNRYRIRLKDWIGNTLVGLTSYAARRARDVLTKPGGIFVYTNRGVGDVAINTGTVRDVDYGPKVQLLSFKVVPGKNAVQFEWAVEVCVPECPAARYAFALMAFNYRADYTIGQYGETVVTYSGYLEIPANRAGGQFGRTLSDSADNYREQIVPEFQKGFRRTSQRFTINDRKTRLDFSITDTEMFGPAPPPGIVDAKASHSFQSAGPGLQLWVGQLDARYWVGKGYSKGLPTEAFLALVADRTGHAARILGRSPASFVPLSLRFAEPELYGMPSDPTAAFSLSYSFPATLGQIFGASGLWTPFRFSGWDGWMSSMRGILGPRGVAKLKLRTSDDRIADLCNSGISLPRPINYRTPETVGVLDAVAGACPPPAQSWLVYNVWIETEGDDGTISTPKIPQTPLVQKPRGSNLPNQGDDATFWQPGRGGLPGWLSEFTGPSGSLSSRLESSFQQRAAPIVYLYLCGNALRVCYPVDPPSLVAVDDMVPQVANRLDRGEGFKQGIRANVGHPLYGAQWRIRYAVPSSYLKQLPVPANPITDPRGRGRF